MMRLFGVLLLCALFFSEALRAEEYLTTLPDPQDDSGWNQVLDQDGVRIYTRDWPGSSFVAVKLRHNLKTSLSNVVGNILHIEAMGEWVDDLKEARLLSDFDGVATPRAIYLRMGLPWPMEDRDVIRKQWVSQNPETRVVTVSESNAAEVLDEVDGVTRVPHGLSEYVLTPTPEGSVEVIWQGHNEPGGLVPAFLANWMIENIFYDSTMNMRARFEDPKNARPFFGIVDRP